MNPRLPVLFLIIGIPVAGFCQDPTPDLYQYNYSVVSPAFVGVDGMKITAVGNVLATTNAPNRYSAFTGFEGSIGKVGLGVNASTTNIERPLWNINLPVNYQLQLGEDRRLVFGARLSVQHTEFNYSWADLNRTDPNDPMYYPSGRVSQTGFTSALGLLYKGRIFYGGVSVDNIVDSHIDYNYLPDRPLYHVVVGKDYGGRRNVEYACSVYAIGMDILTRLDVNNSLLIAKRVIAGVNIEFSDDTYPKVNAGYRFGNVAQVVVSLYSKAYEHRYKKYSGQMMLQVNLNRSAKEG